MIITPDEIEKLQLSGKRVGLTSGCFDLLHFHHYHYLVRCKAKCDFLIVGVDSDDLVYASKNKNPCVPEYHRTTMVAALDSTDAAFILRDLDQFAHVAKYATFIFKNQPELYGKPIIGVGEGENDAKLIIIPDVEETQSTSALVAKIQSLVP
jgi:cytidyltransferase-like protein